KGRSRVRRIHMIAGYRRPTAAGKALGGLLLLLMGAFGLTDSGAEPARKAGTDQAPPAPKVANARAFAVTGVCRDEEGKPLSGVRVVLYRENYLALNVERLRAEVTGDGGRFHFGELPP